MAFVYDTTYQAMMLSKAIMVKKTDSIYSFQVNSMQSETMDVDLSTDDLYSMGYKPIGVVGFEGGTNTGLTIVNMYISSYTLKIKVYNSTSATKNMYIMPYILWIRT